MLLLVSLPPPFPVLLKSASGKRVGGGWGGTVLLPWALELRKSRGNGQTPTESSCVAQTKVGCSCAAAPSLDTALLYTKLVRVFVVGLGVEYYAGFTPVYAVARTVIDRDTMGSVMARYRHSESPRHNQSELHSFL